MAIITSRYYREDSFTTNTSDSSIKIGDDYLDFSGYDAVSTVRFYTDGGLTTATDADPGDDFSCGIQLKINGSWTANIDTDWLYIPPWGDDVRVEGYFDVSSRSDDIIRYGIDGIRLKFGTYSKVKAWGDYDYICEFTATKEVNLGEPSITSLTQTDTHININWSHASYDGSATRQYYVIASNYDLWESYKTLGTGYTGKSASIAIDDSWRGYPLNIYVVAYASDVPYEKWSGGMTITPTVFGYIWYCNGSTWVQCVPYYGTGGTWKECIPYYGSGGVWKEVE